MKIKNLFTVLFGKAMVGALHLMGRDAGNFPGLVLWTLNKKCLEAFQVDCPIIAVTGTNGKTSTTNIINRIFEENAKAHKKTIKIINNKAGNNLDTGICSLLLNHCSLTGKVEADYLILETDESHVPVVYSQLKLHTLVVLNFFRDQLDRNGEVETLILKLKKFCETFEGNLLLNADDPNTARLGFANPNNKNVRYFSVEKYKYATDKLHEAGEGRFCPNCAEALEYDYYQYSHIGRFRCPKCGYGDFCESDYYSRFTDVDTKTASFTADGERYTATDGSIYHIYNLCAVYSAAKLYGIDKAVIHDVFENFRVNNGRMERFEYDGCTLTLNLAKNPVGANMTIRTLNECDGEKELLFVLNDNIADGCDVSWIWDINFSIFNDVSRVITSGSRAYDIAVRIKCSGYDADKITVCPDLDDAVAELYRTKARKFAVANYTALPVTRAALIKYTGKGGENNG